MPRMTPVSCTGKKPLGVTTYRYTVATSVAMATNIVVGWCCKTNRSVAPYMRMTSLKPHSEARYIQPCSEAGL